MSVGHQPGLFTRRGWLTLQVGRYTHRLGKIARDEYEAMRQGQRRAPVLVGRVGERSYWWFQDRFYWDNDNLLGEEVYALLVTRQQRDRQRIQMAQAVGYGRYRMRARLDRGWPARVHAALPDGAWGEGMSRGEHGSGLLCSAAQSVCDTLREVHEIAWPVCAAHGRDPATAIWDDEPVALIKKAPGWWCTRARHALAPVGQLTAKLAIAP